jgi:hypothetical protein
MRACAACHQVWATSLLVRVGSRWLCQLCKARALDDGTMERERARYRSSLTAADIKRWGFIFTLVAILEWFGVRLVISDRLNHAVQDLRRRFLIGRRPLCAEGTQLFVVAAQPDGGQIVHPARVLGNESRDGTEFILTGRHESRRGDGSATRLRLDARSPCAT